MLSNDIYVNNGNSFSKNYKENYYNSTSQDNINVSDLRNKSDLSRITNNFKKRILGFSYENDCGKYKHESIEEKKVKLSQSNHIILEKKEIVESYDMNLYKEYVQWDFINNILYSKCEKLMNIERRNKQELTNTLQRWLIFINENFNDVPKHIYYPILPNINESHPAAQFLKRAFVEKNFIFDQDADIIVEKILNIIKKSHNNVVPHDFIDPLYVEYDQVRNIIVVNKFQSPEVPRVNLLVSRGGIIPSALMLLRYESFGNGGYQWGDPKEVHRVLYSLFNVRYEGFASPVNSRFIEFENSHFCSLFPETDGVFGSLGNFFDVDMKRHCGGWSVNPPFLNDLMKNVADRINNILDSDNSCYFFCTFPSWKNDEGWKIMNKSRHLVKRFDLKPNHFVIQDAYGGKFEPKMEMNLFVLGQLPSNTARLTELGNILIIDNEKAMPLVCPW